MSSALICLRANALSRRVSASVHRRATSNYLVAADRSFSGFTNNDESTKD
jgi:hypothetical protein